MKLKLVAAMLLVATALGIVVQSLGDDEVPIGSAAIMLVAALITWLVRSRWGAVAALVACTFLITALAATGSFEYLVEIQSTSQSVGLWIQTGALVAALPCAIGALLGQSSTGAPPATGEAA
jgi:hypothetical protein